MSQAVYDICVVQHSRSLKALKNILLKSREFATQRSFDENSFLTLKAAPDMFDLCRQVQIATDTAKGACARLSGKPAPIFEDNEKSLDQLLARIDKTLEFVNEFDAKDFAEYKNKKVSFPWNKTMFLSGEDYFNSYASPNFYFHLTATYMLLRSHGVNIGKADFTGELNWQKI